MVDNVLKKSSKPEKVLWNSLNATRDLFLYRTLALLESGLWPIKVAQECWLVTADKGLKALSKCISYAVEPVFKQAIIYHQYQEELNNNEYLQKSQKYIERVRNRRLAKIFDNQFNSESKHKKIAAFQKKLEDYFIKGIDPSF